MSAGALLAAIVSAARWWNRSFSDWCLLLVLVTIGVSAVLVTNAQVNDYRESRAAAASANELELEPSLDTVSSDQEEVSAGPRATALPVEMIGLPVMPRARITGAAAPAASENPYFRRPGQPMPVPAIAGNR